MSGAERILLNAEQVDTWLKRAAVGDVLVYARLPHLPVKAQGPARVRQLIAAGYLTAQPQRRAGSELFEYRASRTAMGAKPARRVLRPIEASVAIDDQALQLLDVIEEATAAGVPGLTIRQIAQRMQASGLKRVRSTLHGLLDRGVVARRYLTSSNAPPRQLIMLATAA